MAQLVERGDIVDAICAHLRVNVPELNLVKPYHGELDRYSRVQSLKAEDFPAQVNLTTPFALVISKDRNDADARKQNRSLSLRHDISIYVGDSNSHNFASTEVPNIMTLLSKCFDALEGWKSHIWSSILECKSDGEYLITTDLFIVYEQKYYQTDRIR